MSFWPFELSWHNASPVEIYEFVAGTTTRYTNRGADVTHGGHTWAAVPIRRDEIRQSAELASNRIQLELPRTNAFAAQFIGYPQDLIATLTIWRGHASDPDGEFVAYWKGRVVAAKAQGSTIRLECEPVFTSLRRPGLRARYQKQCRHTLYGTGCNLDKAAFAIAATAGAVSGAALTVAAAAGYADGWFAGGMVGYGGVLRLVTAHAGSALTLMRPFADLTAGAAITLYPGCDRTLTVCDARFGNRLNNGAFPYLPDKNPMGGSSIL